MRAPLVLLTILLVSIVGASGCGKSSNVMAPQPPPVVQASEYQYSIRFIQQEGGYTVTRLEYADADGTVRQASYEWPGWDQTVKLKPGQRLYVRAEVSYESVGIGWVQIAGPNGFNRIDQLERVDGPAVGTIEVDEILR